MDKILYVEGLKDYLKIYLEGSRPVMTLMSMKLLEEKLPYPRFMRIHRSYLVQMSKVTSINKGALTIAPSSCPSATDIRRNCRSLFPTICFDSSVWPKPLPGLHRALLAVEKGVAEVRDNIDTSQQHK